MGMDIGGKKGGPKSDINVAPLVDVCLVLLIIFMVTMPVMMRDLPIKVPPKAQAEALPTDITSSSIVVRWEETGRLLLNNVEVKRTELAQRVREKLATVGDKLVFVDFADNVRYGDAVSVMDTLKGAGAEKVALKTKDEAQQPAL